MDLVDIKQDMYQLKDLALGVIWQLPYDMRRSLFRLTFPTRFSVYQDMRRISDVDFGFGRFDEHKCIFIHIPKCAGISVSRGLFGGLAGTHNSIKTFQLVYSKEELDRYFKFAFVRNPWDRLLSAYNFLRGGGLTYQDQEWAKANLSRFTSFAQFVHEWVTPTNVNSWQHFKPQHRFITDPAGNMPLDYLGYFENIRADFENITSILDIDAKLPHHNSSSGGSDDAYQSHYDAETREIVANAYRRDIELLGYDFDSNIDHARFKTRADAEALRANFRRRVQS
ncbi:MAG TPA: sulfotransferase family 2 domain-containing protein [Polyangiaceae bacterium]